MDLLLIVIIAAAAIAAILIPLAGASGVARPRTAAGPFLEDDEAIEREVARYREALRARTLCVRCHFPNPAGSSYCADCGTRLARGLE